MVRSEVWVARLIAQLKRYVSEDQDLLNIGKVQLLSVKRFGFKQVVRVRKGLGEEIKCNVSVRYELS